MLQEKITLSAVLTREERWYVAKNPETGVASQGKTIQEAVSNLKEAVELYLREFPEKAPKNSAEKEVFLTTFEVVRNGKTSHPVRA